MFSGIIQGVAKILDFSNGILILSTDLDLTDCKKGTSISCDGVCLTATDIKKKNNGYILKFNVGEETTLRSKNIKIDNIINLEKSLKLGDEIAGHFVYGHVDLTTKIKKIIKLNNSWKFTFQNNFKEESFFVVEKGSITINGISLTIANVEDNSFSVSVIQHTFLNTNLQFAKINDSVNIEFDYLARFLFKQHADR